MLNFIIVMGIIGGIMLLVIAVTMAIVAFYMLVAIGGDK